MKTTLIAAVLGISALMPARAAAQTPRATPRTQPAPQQPRQARPAAQPADVASPDAILAALYETISGEAGRQRDWDRLRSLFIPEGRLVPLVAGREGGFAPRVLTVDEFIAASAPALAKSGFYERETSRKQERYGNLVHAFSAYESRRAQTDKEPFARGTNSIQLMFDGSRWWIIHVVWDSERPAR